ncbi:MAG: transglycosylase domain-containing protein [Clostridia bacterium]|nr:transglycosylase domain-containing protein [Clostridia bacterium]
MKVIKKIVIVIFLIGLFIGAIIIYKGYTIYKTALNEISVKDKLEELREHENYARIEDISDFYLDAVVAVEDHRFYKHGAVDPIAIMRAVWTNVKSFKLKEGGSTITQQVAKNIYFTQEKTALRKISEIFMAYEIERQCDKDTILEMYVNTSFFGKGYYGIKEASEGYYDKAPIDMNKYEGSMLAGVPNAPSIYAPTKNPDLASQRQRQVLDKMVKYEYITDKEKDEILSMKE